MKTYAQAKQMFEKFPRVRILFENGGGADPGAPTPRFEADYAVVAGARDQGHLVVLRREGRARRPRRRPADAADSYVYDPSHTHDTTLCRLELVGAVGEAARLAVEGARLPGTALSYETPPLANDVTIIGNSSVDLWLKSTAPDTDIQVTLTEVRPDGTETYVQNGWLRASDRAPRPGRDRRCARRTR